MHIMGQCNQGQHGSVVARMRSLFDEKDVSGPLLGAYHLTAEQVEEMLDSFDLTIKLVRELRAMPEVLEGAAPINNVPVPTVYVPEVPGGSVATAQVSRTVGRAPSAVAVLKGEEAAEYVGAAIVNVQDIGIQYGAVVGGESIQTINARNLYRFLQVGKDFSTWIKDRIAGYPLEVVKLQDLSDFMTHRAANKPARFYQ